MDNAAELLLLAEYELHLTRDKHRTGGGPKQCVSEVRSWLESGLSVDDWLGRPAEAGPNKGGPVSANGYNGRRSRIARYYAWRGWQWQRADGSALPDVRTDEGGADDSGQDAESWLILTPVEVARWLAAFSQMPQREQAAAYLMYGSGLRRGEVVRARLDRLDLAGGKLTVYGKGRKFRVVNLHEMALPRLESYLRWERPKITPRKGNEKRIFLGDRGAEYSPDALVPAVREAARLAGLPQAADALRPCHLFRRCCMTHRAQLGMTPEALKALAGWASVNVADKYVRLGMEHQSREFAATDPLARPVDKAARRFG